MANISEMLKSKMGQDMARKEERQAERENLSTMREAALTEVTSNPESYQQFLTLQGDNIGCSAGNVALTMAQMPKATKIGTTSYWHEQGRYVIDEQMRSGAKVFVPPRNPQYRGYLMGEYYDITQTSGKPMKAQIALTDNSPRMETALGALMNTSPVPLIEGKSIETPALYDEESLLLIVNPSFGDSQVFAALATEISHAKLHDRGRNTDYNRQDCQLDAESVGYMICRRFNVECRPPESGNVARQYDGYEGIDRSEALEALRSVARNMGDTVERSIAPKQQTQSNNRSNTRNNTRRSYGSR